MFVKIWELLLISLLVGKPMGVNHHCVTRFSIREKIKSFCLLLVATFCIIILTRYHLKPNLNVKTLHWISQSFFSFLRSMVELIKPLSSLPACISSGHHFLTSQESLKREKALCTSFRLRVEATLLFPWWRTEVEIVEAELPTVSFSGLLMFFLLIMHETRWLHWTRNSGLATKRRR